MLLNWPVQTACFYLNNGLSVVDSLCRQARPSALIRNANSASAGEMLYTWPDDWFAISSPTLPDCRLQTAPLNCQSGRIFHSFLVVPLADRAKFSI